MSRRFPTPPRARKRFGQNFLIDAQVIDRIAAAITPRSDDHLVEIGPGRGALTEALLPSGCRLDAIELDRDLVTPLLAAFSTFPTFRLHSADALEFDFEALRQQGNAAPPLRIVGNLPYNVATPLVTRLIERCACIEDMHFMLQLEVAQRLTAAAGSRHWGRLGILTQLHCAAELLFEVPPEAFEPRPKVQSAIVRLLPHRETLWPDTDRAVLGNVVRAAFAQRRKTLRNNLKGLIDAAQLAALGIDPGARAETVELAQFIALANAVTATRDRHADGPGTVE